MKRATIIQIPVAKQRVSWQRLSNSVVSLLDHGDNSIATYRMGDASQLELIDISYADFSDCFNCMENPMPKLPSTAIPTAHGITIKDIADKVQFPIRYNFLQDPSTGVVLRDFGGKAVVRKVKVQLEGKNYLSFAELQVFDYADNNVALSRPAAQSSTYKPMHSAAKAVDGNAYTRSMTNSEQGKHTHVGSTMYLLFN